MGRCREGVCWRGESKEEKGEVGNTRARLWHSFFYHSRRGRLASTPMLRAGATTRWMRPVARVPPSPAAASTTAPHGDPSAAGTPTPPPLPPARSPSDRAAALGEDLRRTLTIRGLARAVRKHAAGWTLADGA